MLSDGFFKKIQIMVGIAVMIILILVVTAGIIGVVFGDLYSFFLPYGQILLLFMILFMVLKIYNSRNE